MYKPQCDQEEGTTDNVLCGKMATEKAEERLQTLQAWHQTRRKQSEAAPGKRSGLRVLGPDGKAGGAAPFPPPRPP